MTRSPFTSSKISALGFIALIVSSFALSGTNASAADSWLGSGNSIGSFTLMLAQNRGGLFQRIAKKNRQKKAQRQAASNQVQQSSQSVQQSTNLNQWNPFQGQQQNQQTNQNQPGWFQNQTQGQSQNNQQNQQTTQNRGNWFQNQTQGQSQNNQQNQQTTQNRGNWFQNQTQGQSQNNQQNQQSQGNTQSTQNSTSSTRANTNGLTSAERNTLVAFHNQVRSNVQVGPVRWSDQIAAHAQQWADEIARSGNVRHRPSNPYGENLANGTAGFFTVKKLAESWANEKRLYTPGRPFSRSDMQAGHYTQMVWRGSTQIGAGKALITSGRNKGHTILVCNYAQRGNMIGQRPY